MCQKDDDRDTVRIAKEQIFATPWPVHRAAMPETVLVRHDEGVHVVDPELQAKTSEARRSIAMMNFKKCFAGSSWQSQNTPADRGLVPFLQHLQVEQVAVPAARLDEQRRA